MTDTVHAEIEKRVQGDDVVLFMKGTADSPMCGFSATVVQILKHLQVPFKTYDVLAEPEIRQGIKAFSDWPTVPQLYLKGEFLGGCDIVREMFSDGSLKKTLEEKGVKAA
jgi:monothiol glutaredoxin